MNVHRTLSSLFACLLAGLLVCLAPAAAWADEKATPGGIPYSQIGTEIDAYVAERESGLASFETVVFDGNGPIYTGYYGYSNIEEGVKADENTIYEWGSDSKLLVWVSVMQLVALSAEANVHGTPRIGRFRPLTGLLVDAMCTLCPNYSVSIFHTPNSSAKGYTFKSASDLGVTKTAGLPMPPDGGGRYA